MIYFFLAETIFMASKERHPVADLKNAISSIMIALITAKTDGHLKEVLEKVIKVPVYGYYLSSYTEALARELPYADHINFDVIVGKSGEHSFYITVCGIYFECVFYNQSSKNQWFQISLYCELKDLDLLKSDIVRESTSM